MKPFPAVLYIHVIASLGLVAAMGAEAVALRQLQRAAAQSDSMKAADAMSGMRVAASVCLGVLFLSGGYLTERIDLWRMAWPKFAVAIIIVFGALAGLSNRRVRRIQRALVQGELQSAEAARQLRSAFLKHSLSIRAGLVLAAVWLMTAKPDFLDSLGVTLGLVIICYGVTLLIRPSAKGHPAAMRSELKDISREHV